MKRLLCGVILTLLVFSMLTLAFMIQPARSSPSTIIVPDDYPTIQAAVNAASPGETVYVRAGTYNETVELHKTLSLVGENPQNTVIDGGDVHDVILISADHVSVTGFTLRNDQPESKGGYDYFDIRLVGTSYCNISGNRLTSSFAGVGFVVPANNNIITGNEITTSNLWGIYIGSWYPSQPDLICTDNIIVGNNITDNRQGVGIGWFSYNNSITGNNITANNQGISLFQSPHNNSIVGNNIANNVIGAYFGNLNSPGNNDVFYHNSFVGNARQVDGVNGSTNVWDNGYPSGGNYWEGFNPADENKDKIGDVPYKIDENNTDRYPLIYPFECYESGYTPKPDLNKDGNVNILDLTVVARAYSCGPGDSNWNPMADIDMNEITNIIDLTMIAKDYGKTV